jgi:hypothetical protein
MIIFFCNAFLPVNFWSSKPWNRIRIRFGRYGRYLYSAKMLNADPYSLNPDHHHCWYGTLFNWETIALHRWPSVSDPGCLSRIQFFSIPDLHQRTLTQKIVSKLSKKMIRVVHPGSGSWFFYPSWIPDPGVTKAPDPGSATLGGSRSLSLSLA